MTTQTPPAQAPASAGDQQIRIGTSDVQLLSRDAVGPQQAGRADRVALERQASTLKARIASLTKEISEVKAEMAAPGSAPIIASSQVRLTGLESRRSDAEETLEQVENQLAGIGTRPVITTTEIGVPVEAPAIPFDPNRSELQGTAIWIAAIVCIGMPIAIAIARHLWKRTTAQVGRLPVADDSGRLERLEQAVDTIAVEMERMSEGQRYVTKLIAERAPVAAAAPDPESRRDLSPR